MALLIWNTHTHLCITLVREREVAGEGGGLVIWFYLLSIWGIYIEEDFAGFFPLGFSKDKSLCSLFHGCACLSFSDPIYMIFSWDFLWTIMDHNMHRVIHLMGTGINNPLTPRIMALYLLNFHMLS